MNYSFEIKENMAKSYGMALPISTKQSVEICGSLRGKKLDYAKKFLDKVILMKQAVPFKRYYHNVGHRKGMGPGRYPIKACKEILALIKSCEANAQFKGLNVNSLYLAHLCAHKAGRSFRYGRNSRRRNKRTHIEVVLEERVKK